MIPGRVLAIDPGNEQSAFAALDLDTRRPIAFAKIPNQVLLESLESGSFDYQTIYIEMVASYGMPVGREVFDTCVWIGRYLQTTLNNGADVHLVPRLQVKLHHCHDSKAKDSNITQALVDRFAYGQRNHGKGTKTQPGWFHGFHRDIWQAYALGVYGADLLTGTDTTPPDWESVPF
ncbi:MAG: hypothetical protein KIT69_14215 [Propionibacteriaceae bacterium]|nr:hypothetical protein [Propionibacteriaceae bacterium]